MQTDDNFPALLEELNSLSANTRRILREDGWQWLLIWAAVCAGAGISELIGVGWYWLFALPVALVLTAVVTMRIDSKKPVRRKAWPYWLIGGGITTANVLGSLTMSPETLSFAGWVVFGVGFTGFALLERQPWVAGLLATLSMLSLVLGLVSEDATILYPYLAFLFAVGLGVVSLRMKVSQA